MASNPKLRKYSERIREMIEESRQLAALERPSIVGAYIQDRARLESWIARTKAIVELTFGKNSPHFEEFKRISRGHLEHSHEVKAVEGFLVGALDDLEKGFLYGHEFTVAGVLYDSVLEEAQHLNDSDHKDASAVLARVALEGSLKMLARREGIEESQKPAKINDDLKRSDLYAQPMWRKVQSWLDIGNAAAHGKFDAYGKAEVSSMIEEIRQFMGVHFS